MIATLASFLTILFCSCSEKSVVKTEYLRDEIPAELLEIPLYEHPKAESNADVVAAYVILYGYYTDLKDKLTLIKKRQAEFLGDKNETKND